FIFLIPVVLVYWRLNRRMQNVFLLVASYFFYGWWDWRFLALMIGSTTMDFLIAQKISPASANPNRKKWLIFSLILNFSILGTFKYFNFFVDSFSTVLGTLGIHNIPLPSTVEKESKKKIEVFKRPQNRSEEHTSELQSLKQLVC